MPEQINTATGNPVWGGIFLSVLGSINIQSLMQTVILAITGTIVSFCMSALLRRLSKKSGK